MQRREHKRRHLLMYLKAYDISTDKLIGRLIDITNSGLMLLTEKPIEINKIYLVKVVLPETIDGKSDITFDAKCMRCENDINSDFFDAGFQIINLDAEEESIISKLIVRFGFSDEEVRLPDISTT